MTPSSHKILVRRRNLLRTALGLAGVVISVRPSLGLPDDEASEDSRLVEQMIGRPAVVSPRVHLSMPASFANGYRVPMTLSVDSPMTGADHVRMVHVLAPKNPIVPVAEFHFTPQSGAAVISTRVRLAKSQTVLAVADMSDGSLLMARSWVKVDIDGCA
jgi:sulfur-oxidizing protein SoxY